MAARRDKMLRDAEKLAQKGKMDLAIQEYEKVLKAYPTDVILILGVAYKKDSDDIRESPAVEIIDMLKGRGCKVEYHDPFIPAFSGMRHYPDLSMRSIILNEKKLRTYDCVLIITNHSQYDYSWIVRNSQMVVDTRNATRHVKSMKIIKA